MARYIIKLKTLIIVIPTLLIILLFILICSRNDRNKPNVVKAPTVVKAPLYESLSLKNSRIDDIMKNVLKRCKRDALLRKYNTNQIKRDEFEIIIEFIPLSFSGFSEKDYRYMYVTGNKKHCYYRDNGNNASNELPLSGETCGYLSNDVNNLISNDYPTRVIDNGTCHDCPCYLFYISNSQGSYEIASFGFLVVDSEFEQLKAPQNIKEISPKTRSLVQKSKYLHFVNSIEEKSVKRIYLHVNSKYFQR